MSGCCGSSCQCDDVTPLSVKLTRRDVLDSWKARCGIGRMDYKVSPGLYKIGNPGPKSHVLVTANYKMSVDSLRKELGGVHAWILVLDTNGINVWCAAGKGTFGTQELIDRIATVNLAGIVEHRRIILPQLGAAGVAAQEVKKATGFQVVYGPVRAKDIQDFLRNGIKADRSMRTVSFNIADRAVLVPVDLIAAAKPTFFTLGVLFLAGALGLTRVSARDAKAYVGTVLVGTVLVPVLLPAVPPRAFSLKGWLLGLVWALCVSKKSGLLKGSRGDLLEAAKYMLILPPVSSVFALNFTGSTTFTSMSGVRKEIKTVMPFMSASLLAGIAIMVWINLTDRR